MTHPSPPYEAVEKHRAFEESILEAWLDYLMFWSELGHDRMIELSAGEIAEASLILNSRNRYGRGWA